MGAIHLLFNTTTAGADIRATVQELTTTGLGDFWQDSSDSFVTIGAQTFTQRSYQVTEQDVGDAAVAYYSLVTGANFTYTGNVVIGYHDVGGSPTNEVLLSEIRYFQSGNEVSLTISDDRTNTPIADAFVFNMSRRTDGKVVALNKLYVSDVDVTEFAFDCSDLMPDQTVISTITNIVVSPSGTLVVTSVGPQSQLAILKTDGNQTAAVTYDVTCNILTSDSLTFELNGKIVTNSTP